MASFSDVFALHKSQSELDFVDIDLHGDTPLYMDPYALVAREDAWSQHCHSMVISFFQTVLAAVQKGDRTQGIRLLGNLGEPEETRLGVSKGLNKGRGIGTVQATELFDALTNSAAAKSGLLEDLLVDDNYLGRLTTTMLAG